MISTPAWQMPEPELLTRVTVGDALEITGSWAASSTLYEIVNWLAVAGPVSAIQVTIEIR